MPLVQKGLNIMDLPLISSFVQTSVDAAAAEYVAPKSIAVPLKDILAGRDYKLDPRARGIIDSTSSAPAASSGATRPSPCCGPRARRTPT